MGRNFERTFAFSHKEKPFAYCGERGNHLFIAERETICQNYFCKRRRLEANISDAGSLDGDSAPKMDILEFEL